MTFYIWDACAIHFEELGSGSLWVPALGRSVHTSIHGDDSSMIPFWIQLFVEALTLSYILDGSFMQELLTSLLSMGGI